MLTNAVEPDQLGGLYRYVRQLSGALVCAGARVTVLTKRPSEAFPVREHGTDGVEIVRYAVPPKANPLFAVRYPIAVARAVARALRGLGRDVVVHGHFMMPSLPAVMSSRPLLYTFHGAVHRELQREQAAAWILPRCAEPLAVGIVREMERQVVARADRVVVLSEHSRMQVRELSPPAARRTRVIRGGVDLRIFGPGPRVSDDWAATGAPLLLTARRLSLGTGVLELVQAMPAILCAHPGARLAIAGTGLAARRIAAEIDRLRLGPVIRMLGGLSASELAAWYRSADIVVVPSQELEGFGLSTVEALACGTAVVATDVGGSPELLAPLGREFLADDPSPRGLAASVSALLSRPERLDAVRLRARAHVANMSWDAVASAHLEEYARVVLPAAHQADDSSLEGRAPVLSRAPRRPSDLDPEP
jgi:glycosyltransferase involved in cell wall biosynthesis